jgi:hypothetical protein
MVTNYINWDSMFADLGSSVGFSNSETQSPTFEEDQVPNVSMLQDLEYILNPYQESSQNRVKRQSDEKQGYGTVRIEGQV